MPQDFNLPTDNADSTSTILVTKLPDAARALQSFFSGSTAPTNPVAHMFWADTGNSVMMQRNAANTAWVAVAPLGSAWSQQTVSVDLGDLSASLDKYLIAMPAAGRVLAARVTSSTTTSSSSSGNEWTFQLRDVTNSLDLFSTAPGTFTSVGGVGGGSELVLGTPEVFLPDQNALLSADDIIELQVAKVGSPTATINRVHCSLHLDLTGV